MEVNTLIDMPMEEQMPLSEIQNQQLNQNQDDDQYIFSNNENNQLNNKDENITCSEVLKEKNIYNQEYISENQPNSKQQSPKYSLSDIENKENIYSQQQCISKKEWTTGKDHPLKEKDIKDNSLSISSVLKESVKTNNCQLNSSSPSSKNLISLKSQCQQNSQKSSPTNADKENISTNFKPVLASEQQAQLQQQNSQILQNDQKQNQNSPNSNNFENQKEKENLIKLEEQQLLKEKLYQQQQDQKTQQNENDKNQEEEEPIQRPSLYSLEQLQAKEKQKQQQQQQQKQKEEIQKQQLQSLQEQRALLQQQQLQQQQQQQQQKAKKPAKYPEGTSVTDLVSINQSNINYGIVIPGNILEETFEITNKTGQGLVIKVMVICSNEELDDHDEYVYSVRKTVGYEYNEKFVVLIPPNKSQTFKIALKVPNLEKECEIHGYTSVQIQGVDDIYECPIKSFVQIPKVVCTKSLYSKSMKDNIIKVAIKRGKKLDAKIPLKSNYGGSLNLEFSWLQFQDQDQQQQPYNLMIHPAQVQVQPNGVFMVNLLLKQNQNYKGDQAVYGRNHTLKKVLLAKIKNSTLILNFPIMMEIF